MSRSRLPFFLALGGLLMLGPAVAWGQSGEGEPTPDAEATPEPTPEDTAGEQPEATPVEAPEVGGDIAPAPSPEATPPPYNDPRERESIFDDPHRTPSEPAPPVGPDRSTAPETSPPSTPPARPQAPPPPEYTDAHPAERMWPVMLGFKVGAMGGTINDAEFGEEGHGVSTWTLWAAYRHRPFDIEFGPFTAIGLEGSIMGAPFGQDGAIAAIAPTIKAGVDYIPNGTFIPGFEAYGIVGYIAGPRWAFDYGYRLGLGISVPPLICLEIPSALEVTTETYAKGDDRAHFIHVQVGWVF